MSRRRNGLVLACGMIGLVSQLASAEPVQWQGNGHWYEVVVVPEPGLAWHEAEAAAEAAGGYLATLTSAAENQFVYDLTVSTPGAWQMSAEWAVGPLLGGYQDRNAQDYSEPSGGWRWVTGEPWSYTAWLQEPYSQPDNRYGSEDYLFYWGYPNQIMPTWNDGGDVPCTRYVIEFDSQPLTGGILVYKYTATRTGYERRAGEWEVGTGTYKGYFAVEIDYDDYSITRAFGIRYWTEGGEKLYAQSPQDVELVRVPYGGRVRWLMLSPEVELDGQEITGISFMMMAGRAGRRGIGTGTAREVPSKLTGYSLGDWRDAEDGDRDIEMASRVSFTLYPAWTRWANEPDGGNGDLDLTMQMIRNYLEGKGYEPQPDD